MTKNHTYRDTQTHTQHSMFGRIVIIDEGKKMKRNITCFCCSFKNLFGSDWLCVFVCVSMCVFWPPISITDAVVLPHNQVITGVSFLQWSQLTIVLQIDLARILQYGCTAHTRAAKNTRVDIRSLITAMLAASLWKANISWTVNVVNREWVHPCVNNPLTKKKTYLQYKLITFYIINS